MENNERHNDTHSRLSALETQNRRLENALESLAEGVNELIRQNIRFEAYQVQHDKNTERAGVRLGEIEKEFRDYKHHINRLIHTGYGVWIVVGAILAFGGAYVIDGLLRLNAELHRIDKRIELLEHSQRGKIGVSYCPGDDTAKPAPPLPKPRPDQILTNQDEKSS